MNDELVAWVRSAFGWTGNVTVSPGPRGALGQIWRLDVGSDVTPTRFALKEIFAEPPSTAVIEAELAFADRVAAAGVSRPTCHPDRAGRYLLSGPGGVWLRLYDWVDLRPVELTAPATPADLGELLARLHRCGPPATTEPAGGPPDPWYDRVPAASDWTELLASWPASGRADLLTERLSALIDLGAAAGSSAPAGLIVCHRDLHPENVLVDPAGEWVVVDWDNFGPAEPGRELARAFFDWFIDRSTVDLDAVAVMYEAYLRAGGPGRVAEPADFTMLIASRLNFLLVQARIALDPAAEPRHREWAEREIDEALHTMPTLGQLSDVLTLARTAARDTDQRDR